MGELDNLRYAVLLRHTDTDPSFDRVERLHVDLPGVAKHVAEVATVQVHL